VLESLEDRGVILQPVFDQKCAQGVGVFYRQARALPLMREGRVRGIADEQDSAAAPSRQTRQINESPETHVALDVAHEIEDATIPAVLLEDTQSLVWSSRHAINPSAFLRMMRMIRDIDVRAVLPVIHVPTLVIQRLGDRITPPCHGRYLASHIAGARYFEQPGDHSLRFAASGNSEQLGAEIADFLEQVSHPGDPDRVLATILHAKTVPVRGRPEDLVRGHRGRLIRRTAEGILATFDAPGQAIRCAAAVRDDAAAAGIGVRAGIHTGEVDLVGEDIAGPSVQITDRVAELARPAEILVSRTVKDLVAGSDINFAERGSYVLDGPHDEWSLFAVTGFGSAGGGPAF
jgi:hypothetical protein